MKLVLLVSGKTEEQYLRDGIREYEERIKRYAGFEIRDVGSLKNTASMPVPEQKRREAEMFFRHIGTGDIVVLLDERGKEMRSVEFAAFLNRNFISGNKNLVFLIGGPYGFDDLLKQRAGDQHFTFKNDLLPSDGPTDICRTAVPRTDYT